MFHSLQKDTDADGVGNACDKNRDRDHDGIKNSADNCVDVVNTAQLNHDDDQYGDECDDDDDNDGVLDTVDNCPLVANLDQLDSNGEKERGGWVGGEEERESRIGCSQGKDD